MQSFVLMASSLVVAVALVTPFATRKDDKHPDAACISVEARDRKIVLLCASMESFARIELPCQTNKAFRGFVDAQRLGAIGVDCPSDLMLSVDGESRLVHHGKGASLQLAVRSQTVPGHRGNAPDSALMQMDIG